MKILNKTRKTILCARTKIAESFFQKTKGLMFRKSLKEKTGLLMIFQEENRTGIWMLGMRFPIDIVFIDSRKRVIDIKRYVKPFSLNPRTWKVYYPRKKAQYILELNAGESKKTRIGDVLYF